MTRRTINDTQLDGAGRAVALTNESKLSLYKKSQKSGISTDILEEVYRRGFVSWQKELGGTPQQFAFDRVNSFISNGYAAILDEDLKKACWKGYEAIGMKKKNGKKVPNCVPVNEMDTSRMPSSKNVEDLRGVTGNDWKSRVLKAGSYVSGAIGDIKNATFGPDKPDMNLGKKAESLNTGKPATSAIEGSTGDGRISYDKRDDNPYKNAGYATRSPGSYDKGGSTGSALSYTTVVKNKGSIATPKPPKPPAEPDDVVWAGGFPLRSRIKEESEKHSTNPNDPASRFVGSNELTGVYMKDTPGQIIRRVCKEAVAAWQRKEGKDPKGGLNRKGVESYRREHPGSKLKMAVTTPPSKLDPDSKAAKRRKSFCARMGGAPGPMKDEKGRPTRKALALRKWNCEETEIQEIAMDMPPQIERPSITRAAPQRQYSRSVQTNARMGSGGSGWTATKTIQRAAPARSVSSRFGGQGGSMTGQVQVQRAAPARPISSTMPAGQGGSMSVKPTVGGSSLNKTEFMGKNMGSKMADGVSDVARKMPKGFVPKTVAPIAGRAAGALGGFAGAAITTAAPMLADKMKASHEAGHKSLVPHASGGEAASKVFDRMRSGGGSGRSIDQIEKDVNTTHNKAPEAPKPENPKVDVPTPPSRPQFMTRGDAFKTARKQAGGGEGKFSYGNKDFQTNIKGEKYKTNLKPTDVKG